MNCFKLLYTLIDLIEICSVKPCSQLTLFNNDKIADARSKFNLYTDTGASFKENGHNANNYN